MAETNPEVVLKDPLAIELMGSAIPARLAYTGLDGTPRVVPIGFWWDGARLVMGTLPGAPKVRALLANPQVALTIDTDGQPPHILLIRGTASVSFVEGVFDDFIAGAHKLLPPAAWADFEISVRSLYERMARIEVTPTWAKLMDFETRLPSAVEKILDELPSP